jgi:hypothetical protein
MAGRARLTLLLLVTALAGCAAGVPLTPQPSSSDAVSPSSPAATTALVPAATGTPPAMPVPTASPASPVPPTPSSGPSASPAKPPVTFSAGDVAVTVESDVRMRTKPGLGADSDRFEPLLPEGTGLYVLSGPEAASGYQWYEVSPIAFGVTGIAGQPDTVVGAGSTGWVAAASRDGVPWLAHGNATCPATPTDVMTLARLTIGERLACFSQVPITVRARVLGCNCEVDPGLSTRPAWWAGEDKLVLVPPGASAALKDWPTGLDYLWLRLHPDAAHPVPLGPGGTVTVTGMFDHPDATRCTWQEPDGDGTFKLLEACRYWFVTTSIR